MFKEQFVGCACFNVCVCVCVRSETRPEEGAVQLLQEERQAGGEGGPAGWLSGGDVRLPPRRGEATSPQMFTSGFCSCGEISIIKFLIITRRLQLLVNVSDLAHDDHCRIGPELCGKQQLEPAAASGSVRNQVARRQGLCQPSIHLHHAQVRGLLVQTSRAHRGTLVFNSRILQTFPPVQPSGPPPFPSCG